MHSNVTSKNVSGFTLAGPPCRSEVKTRTRDADRGRVTRRRRRSETCSGSRATCTGRPCCASLCCSCCCRPPAVHPTYTHTLSSQHTSILFTIVIIDTVINSLLGGLTLDPAGMHCPSWDDAFVSSWKCRHAIEHI